MVVLRFPDLAAVERTLLSGILPAAVVQSPVRYAIDDAGVWIEPFSSVPKSVLTALAKLHVCQVSAEQPLHESASCWPALLPLRSAATNANVVLFDLPDTRAVAGFAAEVQRLRPGIVQWRFPQGIGRALVRVESPPYFTLLRSLEGQSTERAYFEQSPRVWVEWGHRHPLANLAPPANGLALLQSPRTWEFVSEGVFNEEPKVFDLLATTIDAPDLKGRPVVRIAPRLVAHEMSPAELWILKDDADNRLHAWLTQADDRLIRRLIAARVELGDRTVIAIMGKPGGSPPVLVLESAAYRSYLKLPNLFVPVDQTLRPPLRREAARRHCATDADCITWLSRNAAGGIASAGVPRSAFRPLSEWVEYRTPEVLRLEPLTPNELFPLEHFVVREQSSAIRVRTTISPTTPTEPKEDESSPGLLSAIFSWVRGAWRLTTANPSSPPNSNLATAIDAAIAPDAGRRVAELENQIHATVAAGEAVSPKRWTELAAGYNAPARPADAALAWLMVVWNETQPSIESTWGWLRAEAAAAHGLGTPKDLTRWLTADPTPLTLRAMAAFAVRGSNEPNPPLALTRNLGTLRERIEAHEDWLPIRSAWLAHLALTRLSGGDPLALARARDRLFARLFERGLRLEFDVPIFLRAADSRASERLPIARDWLQHSRDAVHPWIGGRSDRAKPADELQRFGLARERQHTHSYADFILAWGLARLGEEQAATELIESARVRLGIREPVHGWLSDAFAFRIAQAGSGRGVGPWHAELRSRLDSLSLDGRFAVERMRQHSRILEPARQLDGFAVVQPTADESLANISDREELAQRANEVLKRLPRQAAARAQTYLSLFECAIFGGETLARTLVDRLLAERDVAVRTPPVLAASLKVATQYRLIESTRQLAVQAIDKLYSGHQGLLKATIQSLRRLDLRPELTKFLAEATDAIAEYEEETVAQRCRLLIDAGTNYLGGAGAALDEVRSILFAPFPTDAAARRNRLDLILTYVSALGQLPIRQAIERLDELVQRLPLPTDSFSTNAYFALSPLRVVEASVRAVVDEGVMLGTTARRWLDEDELRVRRRIRADIDAALESGR